MPAVIASAIDDALSDRGTRVRRMPLTLRRVAELLGAGASITEER